MEEGDGRSGRARARCRRAVAVLGLLVAWALGSAGPAQATFPGKNGKIAYNTSWVGPHTFYVPPDVWTVDPDGTNPLRYTTDERSSNPLWSPDGKKIAFLRYREENDLDYEIYSMNADGSDVTDLTNSLQNDTQHAWSPDGRKIVFVSDRNEPDPYNCYATTGICNYEIYSMNADGSGLQRLTNSPNVDADPAWSPDGKKIVFASFRDEPDPLHCYQTACNYEIYTVSADGSGLSRITNESSEDRKPQWSPQGDAISFERNRRSYYYEPRHLYLIRADGSGEHRLIDGMYNENDAAWSPDGNRIAFESIEQIHAINADGSGHAVLVNDIVTDPNDPRYYSAIYNSHPTWSPDGTKVAYSHDECPYYCDFSQLQIVSSDGTGRETVSGNAAVNPDWQPIPNQPPDCSGVTATPGSLWPPNNQLRNISLSGATDPDSDPVNLTIDSVSQDEPVGRAPDARAGASSNQVVVRAERAAKGDGRVYRIAFTASDGTDTCTGAASVEVHRYKNRAAVDSVPPSYDSFASP